MKFCENCGIQLAYDASFCEECGAKQKVKETTAAHAENMLPKLSETCTPVKREIRGWLMILLLIICSPIVLVNLITFLPEFLFWILWVGTQLAVLVLMWRRCNWNLWIKIGVIVAYVLMCLI